MIRSLVLCKTSKTADQSSKIINHQATNRMEYSKTTISCKIREVPILVCSRLSIIANSRLKDQVVVKEMIETPLGQPMECTTTYTPTSKTLTNQIIVTTVRKEQSKELRCTYEMTMQTDIHLI
jgi:hypothetical protein